MKVIEFKNVYSGYGNTIIHKDLNFHINAHETVAIIGGSGSGKTTLLKLILSLLKPIKGEIFLFGKNICEISEEEKQRLRNKIGVVFQFSALFNSITVGENIMYPLIKLTKCPRKYAEKLALVKLRMSGLEDDVFYKYPEELSGGMKKKAALARALALDPELLILDEPTSGLDPISSEEVENVLVALKKLIKITIIIVTHDLATLSICDRVLALDKGRIVFDGNPEVLDKGKIQQIGSKWLMELSSSKRWKLIDQK